MVVAVGLQVRAHMPVSVCELHVHNELQAGPASKWTDYEVGKAGGLCIVLKGSANACLEVCLESTVCVPSGLPSLPDRKEEGHSAICVCFM